MDVKITINIFTIIMAIVVMVIPSRKALIYRCICKNEKVLCMTKQKCTPTDIPDDTDILHIIIHHDFSRSFPVEYDDLSHLFSHLRNLTRLSLAGNGIKNIKNGTFRTNNKLKYLNLSDNRLKSMQIGAFIGLESLVELDLSNNLFSSIPDLFCVTSLRILHLDWNSLPNVTFPESYKALRYLNEVTINHNLITLEIPATAFDNIISANVTRLSLTRGHIRSTAYGVYSNLPYLQSLSIGSPYFMDKHATLDLQNTLQGLVGSRIQELDLTQGLSVKSLPTGAFSILQDVPLLKLHLAYTGIRHLSAHCFEGLSKLTYLDLSHSRLEEIDSEGFAGLTNLKTLNISHTRMIIFIIDIPSLEYLDVSHNDLPNIDFNFSNLGNLVELRMNNCHLVGLFFRPSLGQPIRLQTLDLSYNYIVPLDDIMNITLNVHSLYLQGNLLGFSHLHFVHIMSVCTLDLSSNQLRSLVKGCFDNLENLEILKLNDNMLGSQLSKDHNGTAFKGLYKLTELHLENNNITTLPSSVFQDLHHLKKLMLKKNRLYHLESSFFQHLLNIQLADFSFNKITSVDESMLVHVSQSTKLNFSGNPFNCDCGLVWLKNSMTTHIKTYLDSTTYICETPWRIKGVALVQFNPTTMWTSCHNSVLLCIVIIASFLVTAGFAGAVYRYRWKMKVYYYFARRYFRGVKRTTISENDCSNLLTETPEYDAILSSDDDDVDFVENFLLPNICRRFQEEGTQGVRHNICYPKGDIEWGQSQSQFAEMAQPEKSNKVMIVLSEKYMLTPSKADFELEVARHRRREEGKHVIIIIFIGTAELHAKAPADIRMLLDDNQQTVRWDRRWQEDPERHRDAIQVFYEKVKDLLDLQEMDMSLLCA